MGVWRPSKGHWGIFGQTSGSKTAEKAFADMTSSIKDIEGRRQPLEDYYSQLGQIKTAGEDVKNLSALEDFLSSSYDIGTKSENRVARTNIARLTDTPAEEKMRSLKSQAELAQETRDIDSLRGNIELGMRKQKDMYSIDDLIRQLSMERTSYS